jgi:MerR family transcriptional regulator/heat shock protein HspR
MTATLMTIARAAQEAGVSPNTLRIYERLGLLTPSRDTANRRLYSPVDVAQAKRVVAQRLANRGAGLRHPRPEAI